MSIHFLCPFGHKLVVPDHRSGKRGRCPTCYQRVIVPVPNPAPSGKSKREWDDSVGMQSAAAQAMPLGFYNSAGQPTGPQGQIPMPPMPMTQMPMTQMPMTQMPLAQSAMGQVPRPPMAPMPAPGPMGQPAYTQMPAARQVPTPQSLAMASGPTMNIPPGMSMPGMSMQTPSPSMTMPQQMPMPQMPMPQNAMPMPSTAAGQPYRGPGAPLGSTANMATPQASHGTPASNTSDLTFPDFEIPFEALPAEPGGQPYTSPTVPRPDQPGAPRRNP